MIMINHKSLYRSQTSRVTAAVLMTIMLTVPIPVKAETVTAAVAVGGAILLGGMLLNHPEPFTVQASAIVPMGTQVYVTGPYPGNFPSYPTSGAVIYASVPPAVPGALPTQRAYSAMPSPPVQVVGSPSPQPMNPSEQPFQGGQPGMVNHPVAVSNAYAGNAMPFAPVQMAGSPSTMPMHPSGTQGIHPLAPGQVIAHEIPPSQVPMGGQQPVGVVPGNPPLAQTSF